MGRNLFIHFPVKDIDFSFFVFWFLHDKLYCQEHSLAYSLVLQGERLSVGCISWARTAESFSVFIFSFTR